MTGMTLNGLRGGKMAKGTSIFSACMFTFVFYFSPVGTVLAQQEGEERRHTQRIQRILESTPEKKLAHRLEKIRKHLVDELSESITDYREKQSWFSQFTERLGLSNGPLSDADIQAFKSQAEEVRQAYAEAISDFENEGQRLIDRKPLSSRIQSLIRERHRKALSEVKGKFENLNSDMHSLASSTETGNRLEALKILKENLESEQFKRTHTPVEPENLPWRAPSDEVRAPKLSKSDLQAALGIDPFAGYTQLASASSLHSLWQTPEENRPASEDLDATMDAQITDDIRTLAATLNNNPTEIYAWVHNNIRYIPSHGSIQGAQYTLENKRGNAVDTASLLIALLRAAGVPARYAYGTVEISAEKVMNWVGGATAPEAAQSLLGQGGVPNIALVSGGRVKTIRMEHTWVEAYVDFEPSRGLNNIEGDRWIPMDASFKQYEFTEGMSLSENVPFDPQALVAEIEQSATINEEAGWVQGIPQVEIEQHLADFESKLKTYINNQNPDATVGEALGLQTIEILPPRPLAAGLPYEHILTQQVFSEVPNSLRHRFKYELATQSSGYPNAPFIALNEPTVKLAGKKLVLSFRPATEDDREIIESYLPEPDPETGEIDPNDLPDTLPGYLINLTAELSANGELLQSGPAQTMGAELYETLGLYSPAHKWFTSVNHPIAGEYRAIGLDLQGISQKQVGSLKSELKSTKAKLESGDANHLAALTKHEVMGDLIYGTIMSYFALNDVQDEIQAQAADMITYRLPSYGIFSTTLQPQYWFGVPRNTTFSGLTMDVDAVTFHGAAKDGDRAKRINFTRASGARLSAMEHLVPEQMFSTDENPAHGISAVKALALAAAQGQRLWTINQDNLSEALAAIDLGAEVEAEISNSVLAGNVAMAHETQLVYHGWVGNGYLLIDPETGAGAYKISGGFNGSSTSNTGEAPVNVLNFLWEAILGVIEEVGDAADRSVITFSKRVFTVLDYLATFKSCWNQFELLMVLVMSFAIAFFAAVFVGIFALIWLKVLVGAILAVATGLALEGLRREYCGD